MGAKFQLNYVFLLCPTDPAGARHLFPADGIGCVPFGWSFLPALICRVYCCPFGCSLLVGLINGWGLALLHIVHSNLGLDGPSISKSGLWGPMLVDLWGRCCSSFCRRRPRLSGASKKVRHWNLTNTNNINEQVMWQCMYMFANMIKSSSTFTHMYVYIYKYIWGGKNGPT